MSLQIQPRALDIENDLNIIQGIILNILYPESATLKILSKILRCCSNNTSKCWYFFSPATLPQKRVEKKRRFTPSRQEDDVNWISPRRSSSFSGDHRGIQNEKKERGNLKCKE